MTLTKHQARTLLKERGLRSTAPRVAVLRVLSIADRPLSYGEVHERLSEGDWDRTTIYRNLIKLRDAGLAPLVSRADGIDRYSLAGSGSHHHHPHFMCEDCGTLICLPANVIAPKSLGTGWSTSIAEAMVHLRGTCPDCLPAS